MRINVLVDALTSATDFTMRFFMFLRDDDDEV